MFPKYIHQIWFDFKNGVEIDEERKELMKMNQLQSIENKCQYEMWEFTKAAEFVRTYYPYYVSFFAKNWEFNIIKCDFFRYLLMYHFGGLYVDLDFVLNSTFVEMYDDHVQYEVVLFEEWYDSVNLKRITSSKGSLHNGFLLSKPKNEFWLKMINHLVNAAQSIQTKADVWKHSGTNLLRNTYLKEKDLEIIHCAYYRVCAYKCIGNNGQEIRCTNRDIIPFPLCESKWRFFSLEEYKDEIKKNSEVFKNCYAVCIGIEQGSLWVNK